MQTTEGTHAAFQPVLLMSAQTFTANGYTHFTKQVCIWGKSQMA